VAVEQSFGENFVGKLSEIEEADHVGDIVEVENQTEDGDCLIDSSFIVLPSRSRE
jgi:hypothetical protein